MNKFSPIILILLTACSTNVPVTAKFPQVPPSLMEPSEGLVPLDPNKRELTDLFDNVAENYGRYHILEEKYSAWQFWYEQQKKIFEGIQK
jgi:hypothetical protein